MPLATVHVCLHFTAFDTPHLQLHVPTDGWLIFRVAFESMEDVGVSN